MTPADRAAFAQLITDTMAFYRRDASKFTLNVWWEACKGCELEQVSKALTQHALDPERGQFAPMPADIVRLLVGTHTDRALIAWSKVMEGMQRVGAYQSVAFDDPAIHAAVEDVGGWQAVCRTDGYKELSHLQRRFCDSYRAYVRRPDGFAYPARLGGQSQGDNALRGYTQQPPMLIGDAARAESVMRQGVVGNRAAMVQITQAVASMRIGRNASPTTPKE